MQVDAHQHFWRVGRGDYGWLTPQAHPDICRDFGPDDLRPLLAAADIERTVLVQAAPTAEETEFLLTLATATPFVAGVVGWADLAAPDAPAAIEALAAEPKLLGLRPMLQDLSDDAWILHPRIGAALDAMERLGMTFDALVKPRHLSHVARLVEARPGLRVVIDHGAKPDIAAGELGGWASQVRAIGRGSGTFCKLSGLPSEAQAGWGADDLRPYVDVLVDAFGPARLMWGSDWPVVNEAGGYAAWRAAAEALTAHLSDGDRALIFGGTAAAFYGISA